MNKFTTGLVVVGMTVAASGMILGTFTNDNNMHHTGMLLGILMMGLVTTHTVLEIKKMIEKGMK